MALISFGTCFKITDSTLGGLSALEGGTGELENPRGSSSRATLPVILQPASPSAVGGHSWSARYISCCYLHPLQLPKVELSSSVLSTKLPVVFCARITAPQIPKRVREEQNSTHSLPTPASASLWHVSPTYSPGDAKLSTHLAFYQNHLFIFLHNMVLAGALSPSVLTSLPPFERQVSSRA